MQSNLAEADENPDIDVMGEKSELLLEMEAMLREQIELHPMEVRPRLRIAKVHAELGRKDAFLTDAQAILLLIQNDPKHPARQHLRELARSLEVTLPAIDGSEQPAGGPRRRLGEDKDSRGYFEHLDELYKALMSRPGFIAEHDRQLIRNFNRPSPLMHLRRLSHDLGGAQIALKREDMLGQGTRLMLTVAGQVLLARKLGFSTVVTGSASVRAGTIMSALAARYGMNAVTYVSDQRARQNSALILQIRCFGGRIVHTRLRDSARDEAMEFCLQDAKSRFMVMGVDGAPDPFPALNEQLVSTLGREVKAQANGMFKCMPDLLVCRGKSTADAVGFVEPFLKTDGVRMVCVEALDSLESPGMETVDVFDSRRVQQLTEEQLLQAEAILEGSEFPSVRREHKRYRESGRVEYTSGSITDAKRVITSLAQLEGLIVPIRTAYPLGWAARHARGMKPDQLVVVNMIEPFDKDLREVAQAMGIRDS